MLAIIAAGTVPMGGALGSMWYTLFPVAPSAVLVAGLTGGLLAASTVASAFAGVVADPVQHFPKLAVVMRRQRCGRSRSSRHTVPSR